MTSLEVSHPAIAAQWHPSLNVNITPNMMTAGSHKKVWWLCPETCPKGCKHEWEANIRDRCGRNRGCPYCSKTGKKFCIHKSIVHTHPLVAAQWHPSNTIKPCDVTHNSELKVKWFCPKTCKYGCIHEWDATIASRCRTKTVECSFCRGTKVCPHGTIHFTRPDVAKQLHPTRNDPEKIKSLTHGSNDPDIWWICPNKCPEGCIHEWQDKTSDRSGGKGCPFCAVANRRTCIHTSIVTTHPEVIKQWHPTKNGTLDPKSFTSGSGIKVWWICPNTCEEGCVHEWESAIANRCDMGHGCPYCTKQKTCIHNSIEMKAPSIAALWHPTKNGDLKPSMLSPGSHNPVWWLCPNSCKQGCNHEWLAPPKRLQISNCPYCSFPKKQCCDHESIIYTHPDVAALWNHEKNKEINLSEVIAGSNMKVWWICPITCKEGCKHEWQTTVASLCSGGTRCAFCSKKRNLCAHTSILYTHPEVASSFHATKNADDKVTNYSYGSDKKLWWTCSNNHDYEASVNHRCNGRGCPNCRFKTEQRLFEYIKSLYPDAVRGYRPSFCTNPATNCMLPYDIFIPYLQIIIELDGPQHFKQISNWDEVKYTQLKDIFKMRAAVANGISVIRLVQEDVREASDDWLDVHLKPELTPSLSNIIFISDDKSSEVYNSHIELFHEHDLQSAGNALIQSKKSISNELVFDSDKSDED